MPSQHEFVKAFNDFNLENDLFVKDDKILVGFSGGPDSTALLLILHQLGYSVLAAHVNYNLRGDESKQDENFVKQFCRKHQIPLEILSLQTEQIQSKQKKGIQELAREMRYEWFDVISQKNNCTKIATAHHQEDQLESILLNISRGTGVNGLSGIHLKRGNIIRPLLFASKPELIQFLDANQTSYRIDSSNSKNKYNRNFIRNEVIPSLKKVNPQISNHAFDLSMWASLYRETFEAARKNRLKKGFLKKQYFISIDEISKHYNPLYFLLNEIGLYGFTKTQSKDILKKIKLKQKGQIYESKTHLLLIDKTAIIIDKNPEEFKSTVINKLPFSAINNGLKITFSISKKIPQVYSKNKLYLDADKIIFPVELTNIKPGDKLKPIGISGSTKISDILINEKVNKIDKSLCLTLRTAEEVIALIPIKINRKYAISKSTQRVLCISYVATNND